MNDKITRDELITKDHLMKILIQFQEYMNQKRRFNDDLSIEWHFEEAAAGFLIRYYYKNDLSLLDKEIQDTYKK